MAQTASKSATQKYAPSARANELCVDACRVSVRGLDPYTLSSQVRKLDPGYAERESEDWSRSVVMIPMSF
jgi:hypothetical protein